MATGKMAFVKHETSPPKDESAGDEQLLLLCHDHERALLMA